MDPPELNDDAFTEILRRIPLELNDDVFTEILRRIPPDDPRVLVRLTVVCRSWRNILTDPAFLDLYRRFHRSRTPSLLGFYFNSNLNIDEPSARFVRATEFGGPRLPDRFGWYVRDARHGRVLLSSTSRELAVWNPITGREWRLHFPEFLPGGSCYFWQAAVVCAAAAGCCDHIDCHEGPFRVGLVGSPAARTTLRAAIYSSESDTWSEPTSNAVHVSVSMKPSVLVGHIIYFSSACGDRIVEYDLHTQKLQVFLSPLQVFLLPFDDFPWLRIAAVLTTVEGGGLGFAAMEGFRVRLWSGNVNATGPNREIAWTFTRFVNLGYIPYVSIPPRAIGSADGVDVIVLSTDVCVFSVELSSGRTRWLSNRNDVVHVIPYLSFYSPDLALGRFPALEG